jgi:hypothetical protein
MRPAAVYHKQKLWWRRGRDLNPRDPMDHRLSVVGGSRLMLPKLESAPYQISRNMVALGDLGTTLE